VRAFDALRSNSTHGGLQLSAESRGTRTVVPLYRPSRVRFRIFVFELDFDGPLGSGFKGGCNGARDLRKHVTMCQIHRLCDRGLPVAVGSKQNAEATRKAALESSANRGSVSLDLHAPQEHLECVPRRPAVMGSKFNFAAMHVRSVSQWGQAGDAPPCATGGDASSPSTRPERPSSNPTSKVPSIRLQSRLATVPASGKPCAAPGTVAECPSEATQIALAYRT
jgi:hypothetical protein